MRRTMREVRPDAWLLAEHAHDASPDLDGRGWHGTMDYAGFTRPAWCWLGGGGRDLPHFLGLPVDVPVLPAEAVVSTMREVHAAIPWQSYVASTMHLTPHDSARFCTVPWRRPRPAGSTPRVVGRDRHLVGLAMQMTMPGVPVVFMGDEIGLTGVDGEHARTPFPGVAATSGTPRRWRRTAPGSAYAATMSRCAGAGCVGSRPRATRSPTCASTPSRPCWCT